MHQAPGNYPKFQIYGKILSSSEVVCRSKKLCGTPKRIRVFSAFCLRLKAACARRVETIRLSRVSDPKKKIASLRESTISPVHCE